MVVSLVTRLLALVTNSSAAIAHTIVMVEVSMLVHAMYKKTPENQGFHLICMLKSVLDLVTGISSF
mgnify:CR=1 FL=1|tara:strand:+ start:192 stop:389 length:198 start_codon:yes stop_codon:yes gene_type:complete